MPPGAKKNLHVPLPPELHAELRAQAQRVGEPATVVARKAIEDRVAELRREQLAAEIASYADDVAGTGADLDHDFEEAALDLWDGLDR